ncbi:unnamed protein product [Rhizophagus irregularis]|nr:unnamed protein product [Rhizophagus irregularis]
MLYKSNITIHTESQAAIDGIKYIIQPHNRMGRSFMKLNNYIPLFTIYDLKTTKNLINIVKVKGHSGCRWNDAADTIAKQGKDIASIDNNRIIDLKYLCSFSFLLIFYHYGITLL